MAGGNGLNNVYNNFGKNKEDAILIAIVVSSRDTKEKLLTEYAVYGCVPEFPIIMNSDGGRDCANLFGSPTTGGPSWLLHPDREYKSVSYSENTLTYFLNNALEDDCNPTNINKNLSHNVDKQLVIKNGYVHYSFPKSSSKFIQFDIFNIQGVKLFSTIKSITQNENSCIALKALTNGNNLASGSYILQIKNETMQLRAPVLIK